MPAARDTLLNVICYTCKIVHGIHVIVIKPNFACGPSIDDNCCDVKMMELIEEDDTDFSQ